ncbi:hypothetical protein R69749_08522 [Paraburkholderia domus]|nr:hypothetical protein R69749_08522 [Paraburkholderia domus]CAE6971064.1 hypothetical protein R70199_08261 [Paraburkholderia domus]
MAAQLRRTVERRQHGNVQYAALFAINAGARPHPPETNLLRVLVDHCIEVISCLVLRLQKCVSHELTHDLPANLFRVHPDLRVQLNYRAHESSPGCSRANPALSN